MTAQKDDLLEGLTSLGCDIDETEGVTFIALPDEFAEFVLDWQGEWLYLGTTFMPPEEFTDSVNAGTLYRFLLELQDRCLGCHFSYDRNGYLMIGADLFRQPLSAQDVLDTMEQIAFVIEVCIPFCDQVLASGNLPADDALDEAFGANLRLH